MTDLTPSSRSTTEWRSIFSCFINKSNSEEDDDDVDNEGHLLLLPINKAPLQKHTAATTPDTKAVSSEEDDGDIINDSYHLHRCDIESSSTDDATPNNLANLSIVDPSSPRRRIIPPQRLPKIVIFNDNECNTDCDDTTQQCCEMLSKITLPKTKITTHYHILLFNSITRYHNVDAAILSIIQIHTNLLSVHTLMSGFQLVVILNMHTLSVFRQPFMMFTQTSMVETMPTTIYQYIATSLLIIGCTLNILGLLISLYTIIHLKSIEDESTRTQVSSILDNYKYFYCSDIFAFGSAIIILCHVNLIIYDILPFICCVVFNVLSIIVFGIVIYKFYKSSKTNSNSKISKSRRKRHIMKLGKATIKRRQKLYKMFKLH